MKEEQLHTSLSLHTCTTSNHLYFELTLDRFDRNSAAHFSDGFFIVSSGSPGVNGGGGTVPGGEMDTAAVFTASTPASRNNT